MVALGGLGYEFAAWEADGSIRVASGWYLAAYGKHGSSPGAPQIQRTFPVGGKIFIRGGLEAYNLHDYNLRINQAADSSYSQPSTGSKAVRL